MSDPRFATHRDPRPWPVSALALRLGISDNDPKATSRLMLRLGIDRRNIMRYRQWGLTTRQADEWAHRAGVHPTEVWAHWDNIYLVGVALVNANKETCREGHPLDLIDGHGRRRCSTCRRNQTRRAVRNLRNRRSQQRLTPDQEAS